MAKRFILTAMMPVLLSNAAPNPWNGLWQFDKSHSSPGIEGAPSAYRFTVSADGRLRWEIPSLGEVVVGRIDGRAMPIRRATPTPGQTLAVRAVGLREWRYEVAHNGIVDGGGQMMLVDNATAWVDLTWGSDGPGHGVELVYRKTAAH
jgi:hypothetical protein